ncbi:hypothetical protein ACET3Z_020527 [Daucus carota]
MDTGNLILLIWIGVVLTSVICTAVYFGGMIGALIRWLSRTCARRSTAVTPVDMMMQSSTPPKVYPDVEKGEFDLIPSGFKKLFIEDTDHINQELKQERSMDIGNLILLIWTGVVLTSMICTAVYFGGMVGALISWLSRTCARRTTAVTPVDMMQSSTTTNVYADVEKGKLDVIDSTSVTSDDKKTRNIVL